MLAARWGRMVTISSSSAQSGSPRLAHYVAAKAGVIGLTKALALELAPHGITVNNIPPGMIDTPMLRRAEADGDIGKLEKMAPRMIPVGRVGTPEEIAATCGFLCSDAGGLHHRTGGRRQRRHGPVNGHEGATRMKPSRSPRQYPKPPEGTWTEHYPELDTAPVSYESSISPEFYELEREAVFKRAWLNVGRVEQLRRKGSFFTKELAVAKTSLIIVRGMDDEIRAFHNVCRHRGNKLVWTDDPRVEIRRATAGSSPASTTAGGTISTESCRFILQEGEFFGIDKANYGLVSVHCEVWKGFIFVNLAKEPSQTLREFLGPMITAIDYPFQKLTRALLLSRRHPQQLEGLPGCLPGVLSPAHPARPAEPGDVESQLPGDGVLHHALPDRRPASRGLHERGGRRAAAAGSLEPHRGADAQRPLRPVGHGRHRYRGVPARPQSREEQAWGLDSFQIFPNFAIVFWETGWYLTYHYWPLAHNRLLFEANIYFVPSRNVRERLAHELAATTIKEYALQDCGTLEATQMGLESRVVTAFPLGDQELMCRHLNKVVNDWVDDYRRKHAEG